MKTPRTIESFFLKVGKSGEFMYSNMVDRNITAKANYYNKKVKTERVIIIENKLNDPICVSYTKITILSNAKQHER
jgi:hypothetical protein